MEIPRSLRRSGFALLVGVAIILLDVVLTSIPYISNFTIAETTYSVQNPLLAAIGSIVMVIVAVAALAMGVWLLRGGPSNRQLKAGLTGVALWVVMVPGWYYISTAIMFPAFVEGAGIIAGIISLTAKLPLFLVPWISGSPRRLWIFVAAMVGDAIAYVIAIGALSISAAISFGAFASFLFVGFLLAAILLRRTRTAWVIAGLWTASWVPWRFFQIPFVFDGFTVGPTSYTLVGELAIVVAVVMGVFWLMDRRRVSVAVPTSST